MAIRLKDGKIITKDGKVSCECCGLICIAPNGVPLSITLTGLSGVFWSMRMNGDTCHDYRNGNGANPIPPVVCENEYIGPQNLFGTFENENGVTGWITASGELAANDTNFPIWNAKTCHPIGPDEDDQYNCLPAQESCSAKFTLYCIRDYQNNPIGWGFSITAPFLNTNSAYPREQVYVQFDGQPINGNPYRVFIPQFDSGEYPTFGLVIDGYITLSWPE